MTVSEFSKPSVAVMANKRSFFEKNESHLDHTLAVNAKYAAQPARVQCKNCAGSLSGKTFSSFGVGYVLCQECGHLNGLHDDNDQFANFLYREDAGANYKANYLDNYDSRVLDIYLPKVEFMARVLAAHGVGPNFSVLDVGCGGGHFVKACEELKIAARGIDPNSSLVEIGSEKMAGNSISCCAMDEFAHAIESANETIVCMVGVLEHLQYPREALAAFQRSKAKYLFLQLPMFSFSAILEHANPEVFPRQLGAGHTHLYTDQSVVHFCREFGFDRIGEWWYGTDMVDLFRTLTVKSRPEQPGGLDDVLNEVLGQFIDDLQNVLDRKRVCSGVNLVLAKN